MAKITGVYQRAAGRWICQLSDPVFSALNPGLKQKQRHTKYFSTRECAIQARIKLKDEIKQEYRALAQERADADPLTRGLDCAPDDASTAVPKRAYWVCNYNTKHAPKRMVVVKSGKNGFRWLQACVKCNANRACVATPLSKKDKAPALRLCRFHRSDQRNK